MESFFFKRAEGGLERIGREVLTLIRSFRSICGLRGRGHGVCGVGFIIEGFVFTELVFLFQSGVQISDAEGYSDTRQSDGSSAWYAMRVIPFFKSTGKELILLVTEFARQNDFFVSGGIL